MKWPVVSVSEYEFSPGFKWWLIQVSTRFAWFVAESEGRAFDTLECVWKRERERERIALSSRLSLLDYFLSSTPSAQTCCVPPPTHCTRYVFPLTSFSSKITQSALLLFSVGPFPPSFQLFGVIFPPLPSHSSSSSLCLLITFLLLESAEESHGGTITLQSLWISLVLPSLCLCLTRWNIMEVKAAASPPQSRRGIAKSRAGTKPRGQKSQFLSLLNSVLLVYFLRCFKCPNACSSESKKTDLEPQWLIN